MAYTDADLPIALIKTSRAAETCGFGVFGPSGGD